MAINVWWSYLPEERYWLETTGRANIGANLLAPQFDDVGREYDSYLLATQVRDGDIVLHYDTERKALVAWSRAAGGYWASEIVVASHSDGTIEPVRRPARERGLEGPYWFANPISLEQLRSVESVIAAVQHDIVSNQRVRYRPPNNPFLPFYISEKHPLRPTPSYLAKFPAALLKAIPGLSEQVQAPGASPVRNLSPSGVLGLPFAAVNEDTPVSPPDSFTVDPAAVERGSAGHARTLNTLARTVEALGLETRRSGPNDPAFDLVWTASDDTFVAEVKCISDDNEERQLRLGLGQVLRYRNLVGAPGKNVIAVLAVEREPRDSSWEALCQDLGVVLVWPEVMEARLFAQVFRWLLHFWGLRCN